MKFILAKSSLVTLLYLIASYGTLAQQDKYALIIGVKSYEYVAPLRNSLNDAMDMANTLKKKGFTVVEIFEPATKRVMQDGIIKYFKLLEGKPNAAGLVFYSGHGMQVKGVNYLIPTKANPQIEADLDDQCVNMDYVMRAIQQAGNGLNIFILDACRNNPFRSFSRSGEKGLSMVDTPQGSYIVYSTRPGSVASDGTGRNGLFTSKLLHYINIEGLNIEQVFKQVARDVALDSNNEQRPWIASDYTGDFFFTQGSRKPTNSTQSTPLNAEPIVKTEYATNVTTTAPLDYGYGLSDSPVVTIGTQTWFAKNLNVDHFANGDPIPEARSIEEWKRAAENKVAAWCFYNNDPKNESIHGRLYNWYAVSDPRGLAPKGWHVPSDEEWVVLTVYLGGKAVAGTELKSTDMWQGNGNGTNSSGMDGLPSGSRIPNGEFYNLGKKCVWWSSSGSSRILFYQFSNALSIIQEKGCGFSVRCVKD